jgi:glycogen(starch) synthase
VHVLGIYRRLVASGIPCVILDPSCVGGRIAFARALLQYIRRGWMVHVHTNGHNRRSWLLALLCGLAGRSSGGRILTLHSGMAPAYLVQSSTWDRKLAALVCALYAKVICVSPPIQAAVVSLGIPPERTEIAPAFLNADFSQVFLDTRLLAWVKRHQPLFSTTLFFRPEYGFELLVEGLARLRQRYPSFGCVVMGSGERRDDAIQRVREAGLEDNLLLTGDVDHDRCLALISRTDVFVRPTLQDGDSISVREALSLGIPVVASDTGMRPAGAILFRTGDVDSMVAKIEHAISARQTPTTPAPGCMDRLIEIYGQVRNARSRACRVETRLDASRQA